MARSGGRWFVLGMSAVALGGAVLLGACSKSSEAAPDQRASKDIVAPAGPSASQVDNENYTARLSQSGPCKKGQACVLEVSLSTKGEYHINDKYPYKFKTQDPPPDGVKYPKPVVGRDDGSFEQKKATLKVPFITDNASAKVGGTFSLSVCSEANCLMDKANLELPAKVE